MKAAGLHAKVSRQTFGHGFNSLAYFCGLVSGSRWRVAAGDSACAVIAAGAVETSPARTDRRGGSEFAAAMEGRTDEVDRVMWLRAARR
jgi:hypothetical protein